MPAFCIQAKTAEHARLIRSAFAEARTMVEELMTDPDYLADADCDLDGDRRDLVWLARQERRAEALAIRMQREEEA